MLDLAGRTGQSRQKSTHINETSQLPLPTSAEVNAAGIDCTKYEVLGIKCASRGVKIVFIVF
jgi:hypothetical protein